MMEFSPQSFLGLITFTAVLAPSSPEPDESISSVSPVVGEDGQQYYLNCREKNKDVHTGEDESNVTDKMCAKIFKSAFFNDVHKVYPVSRGSEGNKCLAKRHNSQETVEYRISPEYTLDSVGRRGRFVIQDEAVIAIAEQPANVSDFDLHSKSKAFKDSMGKLAILGSDEGRSICDLTAFNKFRLCSTVLNAEKYRLDVFFWPGTEPSCTKKKLVSFRDGDEKLRWSFTKWAIECTAEKIGRGKQTPQTFHISKTVLSPNRYVLAVGADRNTAVLSALADVNLDLAE